MRQFNKPGSATILYAAQVGQLSPAPAVSRQQGQNEDWRQRRQTRVFPAHEPQSDGILLKFPQVKTLPFLTLLSQWSSSRIGSWRHLLSNLCPDINFQFPQACLTWKPPFHFFSQTEITFTPKVPLPGRYVVVVHYHQPEHSTFPVEVQVNTGHQWKGECFERSGELTPV